MRQLGGYVAAALSVTLLLGACEESVNPILESSQRFTIFGTLDMNQDTQYVRVIPIRPILEPADGRLEVTFTSTDLDTGERITWHDSTVQFIDRSIGHVFYTPLRVRPGHTYRVEIQAPGSDVITSAETTLPGHPTPIVMPEQVMSFTTPSGTSVTATQEILWQGVTRAPYAIEHWYRFFVIDDYSFRDVNMPNSVFNVPDPNTPDTWQVRLNLVGDRIVVDTLIELTQGTALAGLGMTLTLLDEAFVPPGGVFDPEVLSQPGTLSNVDNGFGFLGSVGRFSVEWIIADTSARVLRYNPLGTALGKAPPEVLSRLRQNGMDVRAYGDGF